MKGWKNGAAGENLLRTGMGCFVFAAGATLVNVLLLPFARAYYGQGAGGVLIAFVIALAAYGAAECLLMRTNKHTLVGIRKAAVPACIRDIQKRDLSMAMGYVASFGILLFLMIWEARSRYFFGFVPVILLLASLRIAEKSEKAL